MVSVVEYRDYLQQQYQRIEKKVLGDESINILKQLANKEHLLRRVTEIFEKTFNSERQNMIDRLLRQNSRLRKQLTTHELLPPPPTPPSSSPSLITPQPTPRSTLALQQALLIQKNQHLASELLSHQTNESQLVSNLQSQLKEMQNRVEAECRKLMEKERELRELEQRWRGVLEGKEEERRGLEKVGGKLREEVERLRERESCVRNDLEIARNRLSRLQLQNTTLTSTLSDHQSKLTKLQTLLTKRQSQSQHLQQSIKQHLKVKQILDKRLADSQENLKRTEELNRGLLAVEKEKGQKMKEAYEEEIRRVRGEVEREKRRRGFEGRRVWEEGFGVVGEEREVGRLQAEVRELKQEVSESQKLWAAASQAELLRVRQSHNQQLCQLNRRHQQQLSELKRRSQLTLCQKNSQIEILSTRLNSLQSQLKQSERNNTELRQQIEELKRRKNGGVAVRGRDVRELELGLQAEVEVLRADLQQKNKHNQDLKQQLRKSTRSYSQLQQTTQTSLTTTQHLSLSLHTREQLIKSLRLNLHQQKTLISDLNCRLELSSMEHKHLKEEVEGLEAKLVSLYARNVELERVNDGMRQEGIRRELEYKRKVEEVVGRFGEEMQEEVKRRQQSFGCRGNKREQPKLLSTTPNHTQQQLNHLLTQTHQLRKQSQQKSLLLQRTQHELSTLQHQLTQSQHQHHLLQSQFSETTEACRNDIQKTLTTLNQYQHRHTQHKLTFWEFKQQAFAFVVEAFEELRESLKGIKKEVEKLRGQFKRLVSEVTVGITAAIEGFAEGMVRMGEYARQRGREEAEQSVREKIAAVKGEYEKKLSQQAISSLSAVAQKQLQLNTCLQKLSVSESLLLSSRQKSSQLTCTTHTLQHSLTQTQTLTSKLQRRNHELFTELSHLKDSQSRLRELYEKQHDRANKLQKASQELMEEAQRREERQSREMVERCGREVRRMVGMGGGGRQRMEGREQGIEGKLKQAEEWETPKKELLESLQEEIQLQREKLRKMESTYNRNT